MEHNVFDIEYFDIEKINNFSNFLNTDFTIEPKKNFKENLKDILNGLYNNDYNIDLTTQYTDTKRLKRQTLSRRLLRMRLNRRMKKLLLRSSKK